jgi:GNAT superfamily N-acetyltransferase
VRSFREALPEELPFVVKSWVNGFKASHWAGPLPDNLYRKVYQEAVRQLLAREGVKVTVASWDEPDSPPLVLGYLVHEDGFEHPVVHWIFVKPDYRGNGLAAGMAKAAGVDSSLPFFYTHRAPIAARLPIPGAIFRPQIARRKKPA